MYLNLLVVVGYDYLNGSLTDNHTNSCIINMGMKVCALADWLGKGGLAINRPGCGVIYIGWFEPGHLRFKQENRALANLIACYCAIR